MLKWLSRALLAVGALLLVVGLVSQFWAPQKVERVPLDTDNTTHLSGHAEVINGKTGKVDSVDVRATNLTRVDSKKSDDRNVVWTSVSCLVKDVPGPDCGLEGQGSAADPNVINISTDAFVTDRHTGFAVNSAKYLPAGSGIQPTGLMNKFPFNSAKKTYPMWDSMLARPVDAVYTGTQRTDGVLTYLYKSSVNHEPADVAAGIKGFYSSDVTYVVEPVTGALINQIQHEVRTTESGSTLLNLDLQFTPAQIKTNLSDAKGNVSQLNLITHTLPLLGWVLGLPLLLIGIVMVIVRLRGQSGAGSAKPATERSYEHA